MSILTQKMVEEMKNLPLDLQKEAIDFVLFLKDKLQHQKVKEITHTTDPNGAKIADLMTELAQRGSVFSTIKDPVAWQRDIRKDKTLPNRHH